MDKQMRKPSSSYLYLALGVMQAIHSIEEYLTRLFDWFPIVTGHIRNWIGFFPILRMEERTFVVLNIVLIVGLLSISPFVFKEKSWALGIAKLVAAVELLNGLAHLSAAIYVRGYFPGSLNATGLLVVGFLLTRSFFVRRDGKGERVRGLYTF